MAQCRSLETQRVEAKTCTVLKLELHGKDSKNKHHVGVGSVPKINLHQAEHVVMENYGKGTSARGAFHSGTQEALRLLLGAVKPEKEPRNSIE